MVLFLPSFFCNGPRMTLTRSIPDAFLASLLSMLPTKRYTILYTTTPPSAPSTTDRHTNAPKSKPESEAYTIDTDFQSPLHMEMKRDFQQARRDEDGEKIQLPDGPLFERYQFLTPGTQTLPLPSPYIPFPYSLQFFYPSSSHPHKSTQSDIRTNSKQAYSWASSQPSSSAQSCTLA